MGKKPVFIHSLFRTGSTYIWNKFRQKDKYYCYYEPFHPNLANATPENVESLLTKDYKSVSHPQLSTYYWAEYVKLMQTGQMGLPSFKKPFSFDEFCNNEVNEDQKIYLDYLIQGAENRIPILQFNRSALRIEWFKKYFPNSINIYLVRNPQDQWQSYFEVQKKTKCMIFIVMDLLTASINKDTKLFSPLEQELALIKYNNFSFQNEADFYQIILSCYSDEEKYKIFYYIWLISLIKNLTHADLTINMNLLSKDTVYREHVSKLFKEFGLGDIDFEDANLKEYSHHQLLPLEAQRIEKKVYTAALHCLSENEIRNFAEQIPSLDQNTLHLAEDDFLNIRKSKLQSLPPIEIQRKLEKMVETFSDKLFHVKEEYNSLLSTIDERKSLLQQILQEDMFSCETNEELIEKVAGNEKELILITSKMKTLDHQLEEKRNEINQINQELKQKSSEIEQKDNLLQEVKWKLQLKAEEIQKIYKSRTYRIGKIIVYPLRKIKNLIKNEQGRKDK